MLASSKQSETLRFVGTQGGIARFFSKDTILGAANEALTIGGDFMISLIFRGEGVLRLGWTFDGESRFWSSEFGAPWPVCLTAVGLAILDEEEDSWFRTVLAMGIDLSGRHLRTRFVTTAGIMPTAADFVLLRIPGFNFGAI